MYFCPCSCSKADGENEEDVLIYLPRNLSYAGESYLDRYSVSSAFVHNNKLEKQLLQADVNDQYLKVGTAASEEAQQAEEQAEKESEEQQDEESDEKDHLLGARAMAHPVTCHEDTTPFRGGGGPESCDVKLVDSPMTLLAATTSCSMTSTPFRPPLTVSIEHDKNSTEPRSDYDHCTAKTVESPDSDLVSEEGIFVNMMDDLDGLAGGAGGKLTLSEASDDTYVSGDSMYYSPEEVEEMEDEQVRGDFKVSLEEAVQQAAFNFQVPNFSHNHDHQQSPDDKDDPSSQNESDIPSSSPHNDDNSQNVEAENCETNNTDKQSEGKEGDAQESNGSVDAPQLPPPLTVVTAFVAKSDDSKPAVSSPRKMPAGLDFTVSDRTFQNDDRGPLSSSYRDLLSPDSPVYEDREFNFTRTELRKSTSLKSTKTPPGTPRRKKVVRFADAMGLDLESVRHVLNLESPPKIPPSAMKDLQPGLSEERKTMGSKFITETFTQPGADLNFRERVIAEKVVLENALIVSGSITGVVRVANISFHKAVRVRFTTNGWASFHDIAASYMINSNDGATDRFSFTLVPPSDFSPGSKMECAISYSVNGVDYWDNNHGKNYVFECYAKTVPTEAENAWMHFL